MFLLVQRKISRSKSTKPVRTRLSRRRFLSKNIRQISPSVGCSVALLKLLEETMSKMHFVEGHR